MTLAGAAAAALIASLPAQAQTPAEFYKGKTVNMIVGFSPGGGYDQYARVLARHMGNHIPGNPTIVVQNAPGAGSLTAVRRIEGNLPKDGTAIVTFNPALITESVTEPAKTNFKFTEVEFIGSVTRDFRVCFMWHATGAKTWDDVMNRKEVIVGSTGRGTGAYVNQAILRNVFGMRIRQITGYPGSAEQRLGIERGELEADCGSWSSIPEEWIRDKKINTFVSFSPMKTPDMPQDVPFIGDLAKTQEQKAILEILTASGELGRPYIVSRAVPADRVAALRKAFDDTMKDKEFLAESAKQGLPVYPVDGIAAAEIVKRIYAYPQDLLEKAAKASE
jgi:tripartite-type tricarboxylate transporter receptor subunit TctC